MSSADISEILIRRQPRLWEQRRKDCPFKDYLDDWDCQCSDSWGENKYEVLFDDAPDLDQWLAEVRHVSFDDVVPQHTTKFDLPSYIPTIKHGSKKLLEGVPSDFVAININDLISPKELHITENLWSRYGASKEMKFVLFGYGEDDLLERVWRQREKIVEHIAQLGFSLVVPPNYSIWLDQPHAERLINIKRSLIFMEELQNKGIPSIPNLYWSGRRDLERWSKWIKTNAVKNIAINLQTHRNNKEWTQAISDLRYFSKLISPDVHILITGPSVESRISDVKKIFLHITLINGKSSRNAASGIELSISMDTMQIIEKPGRMHRRNEVFRNNILAYKSMIEADTSQHVHINR